MTPKRKTDYVDFKMSREFERLQAENATLQRENETLRGLVKAAIDVIDKRIDIKGCGCAVIKEPPCHNCTIVEFVERAKKVLGGQNV